jgi:hypothetical protein
LVSKIVVGTSMKTRLSAKLFCFNCGGRGPY